MDLKAVGCKNWAAVVLTLLGRVEGTMQVTFTLFTRVPPTINGPPVLFEKLRGRLLLGSPGLWPEVFQTGLFSIGFQLDRGNPQKVIRMQCLKNV